MEIVLDQDYTAKTAGKPPKLLQGSGKVSKRALQVLPNYTCHAYVPQLDTLFAGRQNGSVVSWKLQRGKPGRHSNETVVGSHNGGVTCMLQHPEYDKFMITGSSDSTLKFWDITGCGIEGDKCIQTIPAHNATITALAAHCDVLLSCSCDKTLKVWKPEEGRAVLKYPWFVVKQMFVFDYWTTCIYSFPSKIAEDTMGEVYVGDAGGGLTIFRSIAAHQLDTEKVVVEELTLVRPHIRAFRQLGMTCILPVPTLNVVLSCSYDDAVRLSDISTVEPLVNLTNKENPGSRFICMAWSAAQEELVLADADGHLFVWNSRMDKFVASTRAGYKVLAVSIASIGGQSSIIATTIEGVRIFTLKRSLPYKRHLGHTQRVLGLYVYANPESHDDPFREDRSLISASVDNSICTWAVTQQIANTKTYHEKYSEISAFLYLAEDRVAITGHENGSLKVWSLAADKTWRVSGHSNTVSAVAHATHRFNIHGVLDEKPHVVTCSYDGHLAIWEIAGGDSISLQPKCELRWTVCRDELLTVIFDPYKHTYITAGNAGEITVWQVVDPTKPTLKGAMKTCEDHEYAITALALDGNFLYSGGEDYAIRVWDTHAYMQLRCFRDTGEINALYVVPSTGSLLSCTRSGGVKMWAQNEAAVVAHFDSPIHEEFRCLTYYKAWGAARNKAHVLALDCRRTTAAALRDAAVRVRALREAAVAAAPASARPDGSVVVLLEHIDGVEGGKDVLRYDDVQRLAAAVALIEAVTGADTVAQHTYVDPASADAATPQVPVAEPKPKPAAQPAKPFSFSAPSVSASTTAGGSRSTSTASAAKPKRVHHGRWGAVVVATAASLSGIPMVLRRSGRLGFESYATPPDEGTRARIFATFGMGTAAAAAAAELTPGCAGADLRAIYDAAGTDNASLDDIRAACTAHRASLQRGACTQLTGHTSFDAVGGLHDVKEALDRLVLWPMRNPETCARFNVRPPKGLLLYGPPGTGKTLLVRALASACKRSLLSLDAAALFACYVGESEAILRAAFAKARLLAPSFLFIDEVESVCGRERQGGGGSVDVATGVLTTLLNELDGVDTGGADVIFLAATNHPEALDSAILRPGRIDRLLHIPQPEPPQRLDILRLYTKGLPLSPAAEAYLSLFAEVPTEGFTGADIKAFVSEASYAALRRHLGEGDGGGGAGVGDVEIDKDDFVEAMRRVMPSVTPAVARRFSEFAATVSVQ